MKELLDEVEKLLLWVNNDDSLLKSISSFSTHVENHFPFAGYALWVRQVLLDHKITLERVKYVRGHLSEAKTEQEALLQDLVQFLGSVWNKIKGTDLEYNLNNTFPINRFCIEIAEKLAKNLGAKTGQKVSKYRLLMPTLKYDYAAAFDLELDDLPLYWALLPIFNLLLQTKRI